MPNNQRFQVRRTPNETHLTAWVDDTPNGAKTMRRSKTALHVEDTLTGRRVTQKFMDVWADGQLARPAAKQRARKIAKRMNHRAMHVA